MRTISYLMSSATKTFWFSLYKSNAHNEFFATVRCKIKNFYFFDFKYQSIWCTCKIHARQSNIREQTKKRKEKINDVTLTSFSCQLKFTKCSAFDILSPLIQYTHTLSLSLSFFDRVRLFIPTTLFLFWIIFTNIYVYYKCMYTKAYNVRHVGQKCVLEVARFRGAVSGFCV